MKKHMIAYGSVVWWSCFLVFLGVSFAQPSLDRVSRYEFADALEQAQCRDCLVPAEEVKQRFDTTRLEAQKKDPLKAVDDIMFEQAFWENDDYYYCVASVVDQWIMNGFPRTSSPYCPGKFCGSSFLTVAELIESVVRLIGPQVWENYAIDRKQVALRAKDSPSVSLIQRTRIAQALRRCPDIACPAEHTEEFDLRLRWCSLDLARCDFVPYDLFTKDIPQTPKLNILVKEGVVSPATPLWDRFDLVSRETMETILQQVKELLVCEAWSARDYDADGINNRDDLCPYIYDPLQRDLDNDGIGDVCDDDIDGDWIKNEIWVVDFAGTLIPRLALLSDDNCILLENTEQENEDNDELGNACDPDAQEFVSSFLALQIDANPYKGSAPLQVDFTQKNVWLVWLLHRDFADGVSQSALSPTHVFTKAGIYMVQATASTSANQLISMVPIEVLPDMRIQAWLEVLSRDLVSSPGQPLSIQHVGVGDIAKLTIRTTWVDETIDFKELISITLQDPGVHNVELQAYNSVWQRVALSQFTVDLSKQLWSQLHASSLDPSIGDTVDFTTILGGFAQEEVYTVQWDFGDGIREEWSLVTGHAWSVPGVYLVKQTIQFRNRARADHENVVTILVRWPTEGKKVHLVVDELQKWAGEPFEFTLETENFPVSQIRFCDRSFTYLESKRTLTPTQQDLTQLFAFGMPGSYPVFVLCQSTSLQRYHAAVTVAVEQSDICLWNTTALKCDMDKDGIPDLCDDDIDGDGISNPMNLLTKELPNCAINSWNINQQILLASTQACASWASWIDNCPFTINPDQLDADGNGIWAACGGDGNGWTTAGNLAWGTTAWADAWSTTAWWASAGATAWWTITWNTAGWNQWWATTAWDQDSDGDGIPDAIDACPGTPESANGDSDGDGCPEAPWDESDDPEVPDNPLVEVDSCTQCPCPEADYASSLWKWDRVRALLLDEAGSIIYKYTKPEIIQEDIPDKLLGK